MKNFNAASPSVPEHEKSIMAETAWDALKNVPFRGGQEEIHPIPQAENTTPSQEEIRKRVLSSYDTAVNREVDFVVNRLRSGEKISVPAETREDRRPRGVEKAKVSFLGSSLGSRLFRSKFEEQALNSHKAVSEARRIYDQEITEQNKLERQQVERLKTEQAQKIQKELDDWRTTEKAEMQKMRDEEFISASNFAKRETAKRLGNLKRQEEFERGYNSQLDDIDEIRSLAEAGIEGLSMGESIDYNGQEIPVIIDNGYPLHFLQSNLAYKLHDEISSDGKIVEGKDSYRGVAAREIIEHPELWLRNEEVYEKTVSEREAEGTAREISDVISTSYVNTEIDPNGGVNTPETEIYGVTYLFSHIRPGTLNRAVSKDGMTGPVDRRDIFDGAQYNSLDDIERARTSGASMERGFYNEISLYRYNENGEPQPPDALVVRDGKITEYTKRHAAFHHVPIIDIKTH